MCKRKLVLMTTAILMLAGCNKETEENEVLNIQLATKQVSEKETTEEITTKESTIGETSIEEQSTGESFTEETTREPDDMSYKPNGKTPQAIVDVLLKDEEFIFIEKDVSTYRNLNLWSKKLSEFNYWLYEFRDEIVECDRYRVVDLDGDGVNEVVMDMKSNESLILYYEEENVYGFMFPYRGLATIYRNGMMLGSSGAAYSNLMRMEFDKDTFKVTDIVLWDGDIYYIEGKKVSWDETMKYMDKDEFKEKVPYWCDYESILTTK